MVQAGLRKKKNGKYTKFLGQAKLIWTNVSQARPTGQI